MLHLVILAQRVPKVGGAHPPPEAQLYQHVCGVQVCYCDAVMADLIRHPRRPREGTAVIP
jgi:hypothetical protein